MNDLISVIIPVYNVEAYIDECFQSMLCQEHQNFEVIVVDDGSTDNSGKICDQYAVKDSRFHIFHTENRGIGAARNLAMEHMRGTYCFFLDPDDVLETDSLSYLLKLINRTGADIALGVTRQFRGSYEEAREEKPVETVYRGHKDICENVLFDKNDLKPLERKTEASKVTYEFFSSLYKVSVMNEHNIRFLPISYGEDTYVCFKYLLCSNIAVTSTKITYSHRRNPTSTTFQYHPFYLNETKKYYEFYRGLFEQYASEYLDRATIALDAQYLRRCLSAIERELFMSPPETTARQMNAVIRQIRKDKKFRDMFTVANMKYTQKGLMRYILWSVKLNLYPPLIVIFQGAYKKRRQ